MAMSSPTERLTNEELLLENPVSLEGPLDRFDPFRRVWYDVRLNADDSIIGHTRVVFNNDSTKELYFPTIPVVDLRGNGFGVALYIAAADISDHTGHTSTLRSAHPAFLTPSSKRVWSSLVRRGLATEPTTDNDRYYYVGAGLEHVVDEAHNGIVRG
jgi:hypothetical protein